jgi:DNA-binding MarR family transcriptional regulator
MGRRQLPEIAEALLIDRTTLTRNFKVLEKEGWIRIEPGADRRTRYIALTDAGEAKFAKASPHWQAAQDSVVDRFGSDNWLALRQDLHALVDRSRDLA